MTLRDFIIHLLYYILSLIVSVLIIRASIYYDILSNGKVKIFPFSIGIFLSVCSICGLINLFYTILKKE
jgi:hypothetical protein